jgi:glycosyltransferase involved in cell wall biosynthesis
MLMKNNITNNLLLSVCIPTYNRESLLEELFESVGFDYIKNVEIVIVDDGSNDGTASLCEKYQEKFNIKYLYQENSGRAHALRSSILNASGEFVLIMDSDDIFVKSGISIVIKSILDLYDQLDVIDIAGLVFLCSDNNKVIGNSFDKDQSVGNILRDVADGKIKGDKKEVIKLSILKDFMYIPFENEKRMATSILWNRISTKFNVINLNKVAAYKFYFDDGLTKNIDNIRMLSSKSSSLFYSEAFGHYNKTYFSSSYAFRMSINLIRYSMHSKSLKFIRSLDFNLKNSLLLLCSVPISFYLFLKDKKILMFWARTKN